MTSFIQSAVVTAISDRCQCSFMGAYISKGRLYCDRQSPTQVVYRANISSFGRYSTDQLTSFIEDWVRGKPTVPSGNHQVTFNPSCPVRIAADDLLCTVIASTTERSIPSIRPVSPGVGEVNITTVVSGAVIGFLVVMIIIVVVFILLLLKRMKKRRYKYFTIRSTPYC